MGRGRSTDLMGAEEVAGLMGVEVSTVWRWCREGRLPCLKAGKHWRVRREAMEEFLRRSERPATLLDRLQSFLRTPDNVLAVAQSPELLRRLDAAFLRAGESRGGVLVKFHGGEDLPEKELREILKDSPLQVERLESEGRFFMLPGSGRTGEIERLLREVGDGQSIWASFDWTVRTNLDEAVRGRRELARLAGAERLVVKTAVLHEAVDGWSSQTLREAHGLHSAVIWASEDGLSLSRRVPMPPS